MDKLFKEKLENHSIPPAPQSWEKVEARISKKNNLAAVLRVAAAIAVAGLLLTVVLRGSQENSTVPSIVKQDTRPATPAEPENTESTTVESQKELARTQRKQSPQLASSTNTEHEIIPQPEATEVPTVVVNEILEDKPMMETVQHEPVRAKRMVLVYSLPSPGKKADAIEEEQKKTGLQKVMDVAIEVRTGDNPLGGLREAKDDLFALEFRKDKNKSKTNN